MNFSFLFFSHLFFLNKEYTDSSLECNFIYNATSKYCCGIFGANIKFNSNIHIQESNSTKENVNCLSFSSTYIKYLPSEINAEFKNLMEVTITNSNMTKIGLNFFRNLTNLKELHMTYNEILKIEPDGFKGLNNLETLKLESSSIRDLPKKIFKTNRKLRNLSLNHNSLTSLQDDILEYLVNLREFSAVGNQLQEISPQLFKSNKKLMEISLAKNFLTRLPENLFKNQVNLTILDLSENKLQTLPTKLFSTTRKLERINLANNEIRTIDRFVFEGLSKLKEINMDKNNCTSTTLLKDYGLADWFIASRLRDCILRNDTVSKTTTVKTLYISKMKNKVKKETSWEIKDKVTEKPQKRIIFNRSKIPPFQESLCFYQHYFQHAPRKIKIKQLPQIHQTHHPQATL